MVWASMLRRVRVRVTNTSSSMCQPCRNKKRIYGTYFVPDQYFTIDDPKFQEDMVAFN
jgi:hypothetical protein